MRALVAQGQAYLELVHHHNPGMPGPAESALFGASAVFGDILKLAIAIQKARVIDVREGAAHPRVTRHVRIGQALAGSGRASASGVGALTVSQPDIDEDFDIDDIEWDDPED